MKTIKKFSRVSMALVIIMSTIIGISTMISSASAQSISASFNPQTQFQTGSTVTIRSVYGIATVMPSSNQRGGNQHGNPPADRNELHFGDQKPQEDSQTYSASVTVSVEVANDASNGGVQLAVQGGTIVINGTTFTIANGKGEMSNLDLLMINGNATSVNYYYYATSLNGPTFRWNMQGLTELHNGTVIGYLNGNAFVSLDSNNTQTDVNVSYITTIA